VATRTPFGAGRSRAARHLRLTAPAQIASRGLTSLSILWRKSQDLWIGVSRDLLITT